MQRVGIIGAGLSGLVAAKTFLEEGFEPTLFERENEVGGVWARSRRYPGIHTQNPRDTYAFSDFPMPRTYPEFPTGEQVQAYLGAYADHFGVTPHVRFETAVQDVCPVDGGWGGWRVRSAPADGSEGPARTERFDFLVVANGTYSAPHFPELPGLDAFTAAGGRVLHSSTFKHLDQVRGKRVVVVGGAKSACDVAAAAAGAAERCTLVFRKAYWKMPKKFFGVLPLRYVLTTRFSESLFRDRRLQGMEKVLHGAGRPAVWLFWRGIERMLMTTHHLREVGMVPQERIEVLVNCMLSLATDGFYDAIRQGRLGARHAAVAALHPGGVELSTGERLEADVVIFGTGFRQEVPFLEAQTRAKVVDEDGVFHLYRNILHPDVPNLGFVGYNASLYSQLTSELGARWLARCFMGQVRLPERQAMLREVDERWQWIRENRPLGTASGTCIIPFTFHYVDDLLKEMGARPVRRPLNRFREVFLPIDPSVYANLKEELDGKRRTR
ncbi:MAG TPA: NAD(P)-binding domain-containing protein, partial [Longimicrobium sp.]|nr:NAD(P)-binding domain-containing protein [Longimicrobium sp.]